MKGLSPKVSSAWFSSFSPSQRQAAKLTPLIQFFVLMRQTLYYHAYDGQHDCYRKVNCGEIFI